MAGNGSSEVPSVHRLKAVGRLGCGLPSAPAWGCCFGFMALRPLSKGVSFSTQGMFQ